MVMIQRLLFPLLGLCLCESEDAFDAGERVVVFCKGQGAWMPKGELCAL